MIARVAVFAPVERTFDYRVPPSLSVGPGARVCDLLEALAADGALGQRACDGLAVVAGGSIVTHDRVLADGDRLDVLVPAAGG